MSPKVQQLTREDIIAEARTFKDFRETKWTVVIDGRVYPARTLVLSAAGVTPMERTNSHQAVKKLRDLSFEVRYEGRRV